MSPWSPARFNLGVGQSQAGRLECLGRESMGVSVLALYVVRDPATVAYLESLCLRPCTDVRATLPVT